MGGVFLLFSGPFSKTLEGEVFPGYGRHESGTCLDLVLFRAKRTLDPEILENLGNSLGKFIKISDQTQIQRHVAYTRICVYMDLTKDLPEAIRMTWEDEDWCTP